MEATIQDIDYAIKTMKKYEISFSKWFQNNFLFVVYVSIPLSKQLIAEIELIELSQYE